MNAEETIGLIENLSFMFEFPTELQRKVTNAILGVSENESLAEGVCLLRAGDAETDDGFVLLEGAVQIEKPHARDVTIHPPVLLGEMKLYNPKHQRTADVNAIEPLQVLHFRWSDLHEKLDDSLTQDEREKFNHALTQYAWFHFFGDEI